MAFTQLAPVELWSGRLVGAAPYPVFEQAVVDAAVATGSRYTGFIETDGAEVVRAFTRTRYPRRKYGILAVETCIAQTKQLAAALRFGLEPEQQTNGFRVLLGLVEGYDKRSPTHTADEVQNILGPSVTATPASVFAVAPKGYETVVYTEPAAVIRGELGELPAVFALAEAFKQERFTVENFDAGLAHIVETRFCVSPDDF